MILSAFLEVLLPVLVVAGCGFALRRSFALDVRSLNRVSMYVLGPALIFTTLAQLEVAGGEAVRIAALSALLILGMMAITLALGRAIGLGRASLAGLLLCTMFMNSGNYGLPTARFAFGEAGFQRALLFFIPQTIMAQVLAIPIASMGGGGSWRGSLRQVLRMPQIYAAIAGVLALLSGVRLAERTDAVGGVFRGLALLADAALPLLLLNLGMQLAQRGELEDARLTALATGLRLGVSPVLAGALGLLLGLDDMALRVIVLQASMPAAVNVALYALEFDARPRFVAGVVAITTMISPLTLTLLISLLRA